MVVFYILSWKHLLQVQQKQKQSSDIAQFFNLSIFTDRSSGTQIHQLDAYFTTEQPLVSLFYLTFFYWIIYSLSFGESHTFWDFTITNTTDLVALIKESARYMPSRLHFNSHFRVRIPSRRRRVLVSEHDTTSIYTDGSKISYGVGEAVYTNDLEITPSTKFSEQLPSGNNRYREGLWCSIE